MVWATIPWAEFVTVVVAALVQHGPSPALGNVIDGTISNILGTFSIGVLFQSEVMTFDRARRSTPSFVCALGLFRLLGKIVEGFL
jgi:hypothetical protein